jgi:hypothetical protein
VPAVSRRDSIIGVSVHRVGGDYHGIAHLHSFGLTSGIDDGANQRHWPRRLGSFPPEIQLVFLDNDTDIDWHIQRRFWRDGFECGARKTQKYRKASRPLICMGCSSHLACLYFHALRHSSAEPNRLGNRLSLGQCNNTYQKSQFATLLMELGARHRKARAQGDTTMKSMPMLIQDGDLSLEIWSSEI